MSAVGLGKFRTDIQGMRAIAVAAVVAYHVWPTWLPGGYIGVDVFFVISGYLITGLLVRELERSGTIGLRVFYARRIRRLLPAASVTLLAVAAATVLWMSVADWRSVAAELVASVFYVENLLLVQRQVDYLAIDAAPSPVQHFWSLSIEEQFYIFWPLLMVAMAGLATKKGWPLRGTLLVTLGAICLLSLGHAIHISFIDPAPGYFLTTTRVWELGIGGLLAVAKPATGLSRMPRLVLGWAGLLAITASAIFYTHRLPFPGYEALLPTLGAAALLVACLDEDNRLGKWFASAPMQYLGAVSYSLYLWHWPIVVFYAPVTGRQPETLQDGVLVVVVSLLCAHASRELVEERFRRSRGGEVFRPYAIAASLAVAVAASSLVITQQSDSRIQAALEPAAASVPLGAMAIVRDEAGTFDNGDFTPRADVARRDRGPAYGASGRARCIGSVPSEQLVSCDYGGPSGANRIILVGDSHAVHWLPALELAAKNADWRISGITKSSCAFTAELISFTSSGVSREYSECRAWGEALLAFLIEEQPDLVIFSHSSRHSLPNRATSDSHDGIAAGMVQYAGALREAGIKVAAIEHTPWQAQDVPRCMALPGASAASCTTPEADAIRPGTIERAVAIDPGIAMIETRPYFCQSGACPVVIGGVLVYRDAHHLTATYARTLAPIMEQRIRELL